MLEYRGIPHAAWFHRLTMMGYLTTPDLPGRSGRSELPTIASRHVNLSASMGGAAAIPSQVSDEESVLRSYFRLDTGTFGPERYSRCLATRW